MPVAACIQGSQFRPIQAKGSQYHPTHPSLIGVLHLIASNVADVYVELVSENLVLWHLTCMSSACSQKFDSESGESQLINPG